MYNDFTGRMGKIGANRFTFFLRREHMKTNPAVIKFMTDHTIPPNVGINVGSYLPVDGYRYVNVFVQFKQVDATEAPVDLGVMFAFDQSGKLGAGHYSNWEANLPTSQTTNRIEISGSQTWHGNPHNVSCYIARFPVMGPYLQVFVYNRASIQRTASVWVYAVP
jgi:hypothetical protein